ncbi:hypothetical protein ACFVS2_20475 [Brevibacillus sp. NPDC058079]|uniref:hypothetical protein n=1 Tax=Brevibacillus sp. NPDC058079 TaxID=3346330 RepID=UPI0036E27B58
MLISVFCGKQHLWLECDYPNIEDTIRVDFSRGNATKRVHTDQQGKRYFVWNSTRMYLEFLKDYTMKKIKDMIEKGEHVTDKELVLAIINDGIENVRFIVPCFKRSGADIFGFGIFTSETEDVLCKVSEHRYKVKDQYKLTLVPENPNPMVSSRDFYTMDFMGLLRAGIIKMARTAVETEGGVVS